MKITSILTVCLSMVATSIAAQNLNNFQGHNGYTVSRESGVVSQLMKWKSFGKESPDLPIIDPAARVLAQLGIREANPKALVTDYEFYGGDVTTGNNIPYAAVTDGEGNTYITGGSSNETQPAGDLLTMKVSPSGTILWQVRVPAVKYAVEYGMKLLLDANGNLVITGLKWNGNDMDIRTIKYRADGTQIWSSIYNSTFEGIDIPSAMITGPDGSVYITGISWSGTSVDYITLKYNADGSLAWQARNDGPGGESWNEATALALDADGNVIVTGYSPNEEGWLNYHTVKYNSAGAEIWSQDYNYESSDPEFPAAVTNSVPQAITTDADNNIYITGTFDTFVGRTGTIKYNAAGVQQWINTYKTDGEITQGWQIELNDDNLYVAGSHNGNFADNGNVLISYTTDGTQNWVKETTDLIEAGNVKLLFDAQGNPIVAAKGMTPGAEEWTQDVAARAKKYSPEGDLLSEAAFVIVTTGGTSSMGDLAGVGLDSAGNVYFTANSYYTAQGAVFETVKSGFGAASPVPEWNTIYTNMGAPGATMLRPFGDANGNTFSTGTYHNFADGVLNTNYFLVKHNAQGSVAWQAVYNMESGDAPEGIIGHADKDGNTLVGLLPAFGEPFKLKKLSPSGEELWEKELNLTNGQIRVIETGTDGAIYLGGTAYENEADTTPAFVGIKISAEGEILWTTYINSQNAADNIYNINSGRLTPAGELVLTGAGGSGSFLSQDIDLTVIKFNSDGTQGWVTPVVVEGSSSSGTDLLISTDGAIYTNGFAENNESFTTDIITAKISPDGTLLWSETFGDAERNERSYTLKQFSTGNIAVMGYSLGFAGDIHNTLLKYNEEGSLLWDFTSEDMRYYNDFHIDGSDKCYIMNQVIIDPFPHRILTEPFPISALITVDGEGNGEEEFFVGPEYSAFYGKGLVPHTDDRLLLAGNVANQAFFQGLYFFETEHDGALGTDGHEATNPANKLGQNYPNPVIATTTIPFKLVNGGKASIKLFNTQGRLVKELANDSFSAGDNSLLFDASALAPGIYFYQITAGKFRQARKMVIAK